MKFLVWDEKNIILRDYGENENFFRDTQKDSKKIAWFDDIFKLFYEIFKLKNVVRKGQILLTFRF